MFRSILRVVLWLFGAVYSLYKGLVRVGFMAYLRGCLGQFYGLFKGLFGMVLWFVYGL